MEKSRKRLLGTNTLSSLIFQITTIVCGFVLPRLILQHYGSEINGLVSSITQFLQVITFLELGVGAVVQSTLYKPLAYKEWDKVSAIVTSADKFFRRIGNILLIYVIILAVAFPFFAKSNFDFFYTAFLIAAMSIGYFAQYYFGVVDRLFLTADQRGYIQYNAQTITLIANTISCAIMIQFGASIHMVKLMTSLVYLIRPIVLRNYIRRNYRIERNVALNEEPIKQKWNGVAQHIAAVVLDSTDIIVLTIFASLKDVSIYSVYYLVVSGVKRLMESLVSGVQPLLGEYWATKDMDNLKRLFESTEWAIHTFATYVWGCTFVLIIPFVSVYTSGITDTDYNVSVFAVLLTIAFMAHSLRMPYNIMILAAGHYKQTQRCYVIAMSINIFVSIISVKQWGLVGVAIGTLAAMVYQTIWMAVYDSRNFVHFRYSSFIKQCLVDVLSILLLSIASRHLMFAGHTWLSWLSFAIQVALLMAVIVFSINTILYGEQMKKYIRKIVTKIRKSRH